MERTSELYIPKIPKMTKKDIRAVRKGYERVCRKYGYPILDGKGDEK